MLSEIKNFIKKRPLYNYITMLLCFCVVILICIFGIFLNFYNEATARNNLNYNRRTTSLYAYKADSYLSTLISSASSLCNEAELIDFIENMDTNFTNVPRELKRTVNRYLIRNLDIYDIILTNGNHRSCFFMDQSTLHSINLPSQEDVIIQTAFVNNNQVFLIPIQIVHHTRIIGTCYLVTYSKTFSKIFGNNFNVAETNFFVLSNTMQMLAAPNDASNTTVSALYSIIYDMDKTNEFTLEISKEKYFVNRQSLIISGIYLYGLTPCHAEFGDIISHPLYFAIIFGLAFSLLLVIIFWFFRSLNRSIRALRSFIADKKSDVSSPVPDLFSNELSVIAGEIDDTVNQITQLQNENLQIKIAHKDSQIKSLQSQLNPHFLYNSLNCMVGMARYYHVKDIEKMCLCIAKITQYSLSASLFTTVGEEIKIINDYMTIQKIRFGNKFDFCTNVDALLTQKKMLRFSLQPLVENAVKYGLEPLEEGGMLRINGYIDGDDIVFEVIDNGLGFEEDIYKEVCEQIENNTDNQLKSSGTGIGLLNIHNRLRLCYGDDYGMQIVSSSGSGTTITVRMPLQSDK